MTPPKTNTAPLLAEREDGGATISPHGLQLPSSARRGVTLIEAVLFISVALGLIVGGLVFYQQATVAARVNEQVRLFSAMNTEVQALLTQARWIPDENSYEEQFAINNVLISSGAISPQYIGGTFASDETDSITNTLFAFPDDTRTIKSAWGTPSYWWIYPDATGGYTTGFLIADIGVAECVRFLNATFSSTAQGRVPNYVETLSPGSGVSVTDVAELSPSDISSLCRGTTLADTDTIGVLLMEWQGNR